MHITAEYPVRVLVTPGGAGSTAIMNALRPHVLKTHQRDTNIHPDSRVCYLMSDPYNMITSFYKRGFFIEKGLDGKGDYGHVRHIEGDLETMQSKPEWTLEELLQLDNDPYLFEDHYNQWAESGIKKIRFIKYEKLEEPEYLESFFSFFGIENSSFTFSPRESDWESLSLNIKQLLHNKFGSLRRKWMALR